MSIKTQGIFVSVVMLIAAIWGADTVLPIVTIGRDGLRHAGSRGSSSVSAESEPAHGRRTRHTVCELDRPG